MRVSVHTLGGLFDDDRTVAVDDHEFTVVKRGAELHRRSLEPRKAGEVRTLARAVAALDLPAEESERSVDGGSTTIEIIEEGVRCKIVVPAGGDPPEPVWALLDSVEALAAEDRGQAGSPEPSGNRASGADDT